MRKTTVATLSAVGLISLFSMSAQAQSVAGALQLGLGTGFVDYSSPTLTERRPVAGGTNEYKINAPTTTWGFASRNGVTLEAGYGLNDMFVLGGLLQIGGWSQTVETPVGLPVGGTAKAKNSMFNLFIGPKLDVMFLPDSKVRPFVGAAIGLTHVSNTRENTGANNVTTTPYDASWTGVGLLGRAGIRWFLTPGFSIDPAFVFGFSTMSGSTSYPAAVGTVNYDTGATGYNVGLNVAFSGWVGL